MLAGGGVVAAVLIVVLATRPGLVVQPNEARIASRGATLFDSREDEIASVQAGQDRATPELWVGGTSMTLLTVDAKLMPILPLIARPESQRALVVAFGMGTAFRTALIAGLRTDAVELVPSVPKMFGYYYPTPTRSSPTRTGGSIIADGRNHLELVDEHFDIIVTDPPPPIQSSGVSVISSLEYYEAGRDHLTDGGVMMQWTPYGTTEPDLKEHIRTFASVFPHVIAVRGSGRLRVLHARLGAADVARSAGGCRHPGATRRPRGHLELPTTRRQSTVDGWLGEIARQTWLVGRRGPRLRR